MVSRNDTNTEVELNFEGELITIRNLTSHEYGGMLSRETSSTRALKELRRRHHISFQGFLLRRRKATVGKRDYELFVVLYGMKAESKLVAKLLYSAGVFLQTPYLQDLWAPYINPQSLRNPNSQTEHVESNDRGTTLYNGSSVKAKSSRRLHDQCPLRGQLQDVVDSAQGPSTYSTPSTSPRLRTNLRKYVNIYFLN